MTAERTGAAPRTVSYAFEYHIPDEFVQLPETAAADGWPEAMAELMPFGEEEGDKEYREFAAEQMRKYLPWLFSREDVGLALALCLGAEELDGEDRLSMGLLSVSARGSRHTSPMLVAEGIYRAKEKKFFEGESDLEDLDFELGKGVRGPQDMLLAVKLPCGPGVMSTSLRSLTFRNAEGPETVLPIAALQLIIPAPSEYCVYVTLATPSVYLLDSYCGRLAHIGRTFSFDIPEADAAD